jgi:hypothetical protein
MYHLTTLSWSLAHAGHLHAVTPPMTLMSAGAYLGSGAPLRTLTEADFLSAVRSYAAIPA